MIQAVAAVHHGVRTVPTLCSFLFVTPNITLFANAISYFGGTQGDITTLAGVYTFSFLGVMTLFSVGTILLKFKRPSLPREVTVSYGTTLVGITCVSSRVLVSAV